MRFKLDENLPSDVSHPIAEAGFDVATVSGENLTGCEDMALYNNCRVELRVLVTIDMDFAIPLRFPPEDTPGIIVLRPPRPLMTLLRSALTNVVRRIEAGAENIAGKLWIVEPTSIRVYEPPEP